MIWHGASRFLTILSPVWTQCTTLKRWSVNAMCVSSNGRLWKLKKLWQDRSEDAEKAASVAAKSVNPQLAANLAAQDDAQAESDEELARDDHNQILGRWYALYAG
eukprot:3348712-Pleurochrysis_carterae.AAC.1